MRQFAVFAAQFADFVVKLQLWIEMNTSSITLYSFYCLFLDKVGLDIN